MIFSILQVSIAVFPKLCAAAHWCMGVGRIFSRGGPKVVKFVFYPSKFKKQPFLLIISKSRRGPRPPPALPPLPTPMDWCAAEEAEVCRESFMF